MTILNSVVEKKEEKKSVTMKLYLRYMVSLRCKKIVKDELKKLDVKHSILPYGAIEFLEEVSEKELDSFRKNLRKSGLDLLDVHESLLIDRIITNIIDVIHSFDKLPKLTYTEIIDKNLGETNDSILKIFSEVVGMSVIQFIVTQKVERTKELLLYYDLSISEITNRLNYESEQHLIAQFKKNTGLTPAYFMELKKERRNIASHAPQDSYSEQSTDLF